MSVTRVQQRLLMNTQIDKNTACWEWTGQISNSGYGRLMTKDEQGGVRMQSAQHVSYEAFIGPVQHGMLVKQICNNRLCINPEHLAVSDPVNHQSVQPL